MNDILSTKVFKEFGNFSGYLEETNCPICVKPPTPKLIFRKKEGINIFKCPRCSILYASPRFDRSSIDKIYDNEAFSDMSIFENWSYEKWIKMGGRGQNVSRLKTELIKKFLLNEASVLDVGCGVGEFVCVAINNNLKAEGIDISDMLISTGRTKLNVPIYQTDIKNYKPDHKYDAIIIWDVLEHLVNPVEILNSCSSLLNDNGYLFAQVPNYKGISNRLKSLINRIGFNNNDYGHFGFPYHLYSFDKKSLTALYKRAGFNAIYFEAWPSLPILVRQKYKTE
ncbi:MAG: class I SAM-dependent methyltransferase [Ignavibacteria bacterium]|nr:class I SAM-dependent methyltransferase [Ignavibacteria bacterium]